MSINEIINWIIDVVRQHEICIFPIIFFLAFGESLVLFSLMLPATLILLALGIIIGESNIAFLPIFFLATAGAFLGDCVSYYIGHHYKHRVIDIWPLSSNPYLLTCGQTFFERWGVFSIFIGRFFGPLRAVMPLVSGICGMPQGYFQLANIASAIIWSFSILAPGVLGVKWLSLWLG